MSLHPADGQAWPLTIAVLVAVAILGLVARAIVCRTSGAVLAAGVGALGCTAYSGDTSWRFAEHRLGMDQVDERALLFATGELALLACMAMARANKRATAFDGGAGTPGVPGVLVWCITGVQVIPAYSESGFIGGTVRAVIGPVMAGLLWHLAMGLEIRLRKPEALSTGLPAQIAHELRERLLSYLGLAVRGRDAAQLTADRAIARAVRLASRRHLGMWGRAALKASVARSGAAVDNGQRTLLLAELAGRRTAAHLRVMPFDSPWNAEALPLSGNTLDAPGVANEEAVRAAERDGRTDAAVTALLTAVANEPRKPYRVPPPSTPAGPIGSPVDDVEALYGQAHAPVVYFLRNGSRVKIGTSQNLKRRIAALSLRLEDVVRVEHGSQDHERTLHRCFADLRAGDTEWFDLTGDLAGYLGLVETDKESGQPDTAPDKAPAPTQSEPPAQAVSSPDKSPDSPDPLSVIAGSASGPTELVRTLSAHGVGMSDLVSEAVRLRPDMVPDSIRRIVTRLQSAADTDGTGNYL
ncbi:GIY-YIG nuclease family protein [Streptomyces sp. NPDC052207]|uniref:GIY-YIG nuclease family protein n=1 Tax=Streptomyces sp. NPDC052207 TaxID=3155418 RepID=UPI00342E2383